MRITFSEHFDIAVTISGRLTG